MVECIGSVCCELKGREIRAWIMAMKANNVVWCFNFLLKLRSKKCKHEWLWQCDGLCVDALGLGRIGVG